MWKNHAFPFLRLICLFKSKQNCLQLHYVNRTVISQSTWEGAIWGNRWYWCSSNLLINSWAVSKYLHWGSQTSMWQCTSFIFEDCSRCAVLDMPQSRKIKAQIDWWWTKPPSQQWLASQKMCYAGELEILPVSTTGCCTNDCLHYGGVERGSPWQSNPSKNEKGPHH